MTENLTDQDLRDLELLGSTDGDTVPSYHTILEVWREVLKPAAVEARKKVTPRWASNMVAQYAGVTFADCNELRDRYFAKIAELLNILTLEIGTDPDCLSYTTPEDDALENSTHYKNLLLQWQLAVLNWEMEWDCTQPHAGAEIAAISEVHKMFFGDTGLTQFLDNIKFEFTEDDQQQLADALNEFRGEGQ